MMIRELFWLFGFAFLRSAAFNGLYFSRGWWIEGMTSLIL